jgi:hypothetical protein
MQFDRRIGATMNEVTNGVGLDRGLSELPDLPQSVELGRKIDRRGWMLNVSVEEAEASLVRTGRRLETTLRDAPSSRNTWTPDAVLAAIPWAATMSSAGNPSKRAATTAELKCATRPVA